MLAWLSFLHRWLGGLIGLVLAVLGLSGTILLWEGEWISLPHASQAVIENQAQMERILAASPPLSRVTFASDEIGLHLLVYADGSGAYVSQDGQVVDRWQTLWERPELWLFDFHHYLFAGKTGETLTGLAGVAGILFILSGLLLWWRGRAPLRPRPWPQRLAPGPIVVHHRDLGVIAAPLLILSTVTGTFMLFDPLRSAVLGTEQRPQRVETIHGGRASPLTAAKARFPDAQLRRITFPSDPAGPVVVRMRRPFEWTPNGRTQLSFAADGKVIVEDAAAANGAAIMSEKLYPLHAAKTGGYAWKLVMTLSGLALTMLGSFAVWSFWARRWNKRCRKGRRPAPGARLHPKTGVDVGDRLAIGKS